jgi:glutathione S-transferase
MPTLAIYGTPLSNFVRTARMAALEKGVAYELVPMLPGDPRLDAAHPFGRIPVMRHGELVLFETQAIARYIDRAFAGPPLMPAEPVALALAEQWVSAICDYVVGSMMRGLVVQRLVFPLIGRATDEAAVQAALPTVARHLDILEARFAAAPYLAGEAMSVADLFLVPILFLVEQTPEGREALSGRRALTRWRETMAARPSFEETGPELSLDRAAA